MDLNDLAKNPDQINTLIQLLQSLLPKEENTKSGPIKKTVVKPKKQKQTQPEPKKSQMRTKNRRGPSSDIENQNKFLSMPEFQMHKDDIEVDKALSKFPPVARMRNFEMMDVQCRICGKKETVSPSLVLDSVSRYKCNNCSTQAG